MRTYTPYWACLKVNGAGVVVHVHGDLVHSGKGMQHQHVRGGETELCLVQNVEILQADIILFIKEALPLHPGHVQKIQLRQALLQADDLFVGDAFFPSASR